MLVLLYLLIASIGYANHIPTRDYDNNNYFIVELNTTNSQAALTNFITNFKEYKFEHQIPLDNHYVFSIDKKHPHNEYLGNHNSNNESIIKRFDKYDELVDSVESIHMLTPKTLTKRMPVFYQRDDEQIDNRPSTDKAHQKLAQVASKLGIHDPEFTTQWHLINTVYPGNDVNVTGLWMEDILGQNIVTAIVDDGVDAESEDIKENFNLKGSWDYNDNGNTPLPRLFDDYHGTRCAGEIAAVKNDVCGLGVAYKSQVSGIRILSGSITAAEEAAAMIYGLDTNDIYSCSWGPTDNGKTLAEPDLIVKKAMVKGILEGRDNKGSIYVFASGNGGRYGDSCNFDGYTNSIYSITVGAIDYKGLHPTYSEACSAVMVVTYSSGSGEHIHTTDIKKKCSANHGGTSAAAPLASGIYALVLSANPDLTWRDLQWLSVLNSEVVNPEDGNYQKTVLDRQYSHKYGYGKIDSYALVHAAKEWKNVKPQSWYYTDIIEVNQHTNSKVIKSKLTLTKEDLELMNFERVEHVTVKVNIESSYRGKVGMRIISPTNVISDLATFRPFDASSRGFKDWTFMSVAHWGESGVGDWTVEVFVDDSKGGMVDVNFVNWQLRLFGESIDAGKAETFDLDKDYAAIRRDKSNTTPSVSHTVVESSIPFSSVPVSSSIATSELRPTIASSETTSMTSSSSVESISTSSAASSSSTTSSVTSASSSATAIPDEEKEGADKQYTSDHTGLYFMALAIVGFVVVLVIMKFHKKPNTRRRRRRDDYEFDIIPGEDYTDSDNHSDDSFDLGEGISTHNNRSDDDARDRLFDEFNAESLPDYENDMFKVGDDDELVSNKAEVNDKKSQLDS